MPEFIVTITCATYYAVQAEDDVIAVALALEGEGQELSSETREASICPYERPHRRRQA
jgi:hypothetical protein